MRFFFPLPTEGANEVLRSLKTVFLERISKICIVGVARFELTISWSQTKRDTGLRYTPKNQPQRLVQGTITQNPLKRTANITHAFSPTSHPQKNIFTRCTPSFIQQSPQT